jgi:hypothetical protein
MPKKKQPHESVANQFSDEEMEQIKRYGQALGGKPTPFDEEVEQHLTGMEQNAHKMHAAQTGGGDQSLGPSAMDQQAIKQRGAMSQQAATQAAAQAQQAQGAQQPVNAPPAPAGPAGTTTTFPAQRGATGGAGNVQQPQQTPPPPPDEGQPPEGDEDPSTQFPS